MRPSICIFIISLVVVAINAKKVKEKKSIARTNFTDESNPITSLEQVADLHKKKGKDHSTSSDSDGGNGGDGETSRSSLGISDTMSSESNSRRKRKKTYLPKSSEERRGWKKWHRKCKPCPEDMKKKWRDKTIGWICGVYQRARRSFKSKCMMEYRNCQDGTMFVQLHSYRCANETGRESYLHGDHFFYEYKVDMSYDSKSGSSISSSESVSDTSSS